MRKKLRLAVLCIVTVLYPATLGAAGQAESADASTIACRVLEAHASARPAATAVIFHQQDKADQARLGSLLKAHSGESAAIQVSDGETISVTIFRLKSCFGRGLLLLPAGAPPMKDGSTFLLRFSQGSRRS